MTLTLRQCLAFLQLVLLLVAAPLASAASTGGERMAVAGMAAGSPGLSRALPSPSEFYAKAPDAQLPSGDGDDDPQGAGIAESVFVVFAGHECGPPIGAPVAAPPRSHRPCAAPPTGPPALV